VSTAADFLYSLYSDDRLIASELAALLRALNALAAGKLVSRLPRALLRYGEPARSACLGVLRCVSLRLLRTTGLLGAANLAWAGSN
jgi:hypothetical protein